MRKKPYHFSPEHVLTLSLPGVPGRRGFSELYPLSLPDDESELLARGAAALKWAAERPGGR